MAKELLTINQAAKRLGVAKKTIRRWETSGKITSKRTAGGHRRFDISKLKRQIETHVPRTFSANQVLFIILTTIAVTTFLTWLIIGNITSNGQESESIEALNLLPDELELIDTLPTTENFDLN